MAINEQNHRHEIELLPLKLRAREKKRGPWMGFSLALAVIAVAVWLIFNNHAGLAITLLTSVLVAIAAVFVIEYHPNNKKSND